MHACDNVRKTCELTCVIGRVNKRSHLWKLATWSFEYCIPTPTQINTCSNELLLLFRFMLRREVDCIRLYSSTSKKVKWGNSELLFMDLFTQMSNMINTYMSSHNHQSEVSCYFIKWELSQIRRCVRLQRPCSFYCLGAQERGLWYIQDEQYKSD